MSKEMGEMGRSRKVGQAGVSAPLEGARRATGLGAEGASAGPCPCRKRDVVLRLLRGDSDVLCEERTHHALPTCSRRNNPCEESRHGSGSRSRVPMTGDPCPARASRVCSRWGLAHFGRSSGRRVGVHGHPKATVRSGRQAAWRW